MRRRLATPRPIGRFRYGLGFFPVLLLLLWFHRILVVLRGRSTTRRPMVVSQQGRQFLEPFAALAVRALHIPIRHGVRRVGTAKLPSHLLEQFVARRGGGGGIIVVLVVIVVVVVVIATQCLVNEAQKLSVKTAGLLLQLKGFERGNVVQKLVLVKAVPLATPLAVATGGSRRSNEGSGLIIIILPGRGAAENGAVARTDHRTAAPQQWRIIMDHFARLVRIMNTAVR
mmetsp:Transcript_4411/g.12227  ORF Transcript_4411/g.12227 Transcript_4411/m.12227 type:complete len:228 (-) Transcript_4411:306-989(-)